MNKVKNIIIGFGKAGTLLAPELGRWGERTVLIEQDSKLHEKASVNIAYLSNIKIADLAKKRPETIDRATYYRQAIRAKDGWMNQLNKNRYLELQKSPNIEIIKGKASFLSANEILVRSPEGQETTYAAERFFINTGSQADLPSVEGLEVDGETVHTFETLLKEEELPEKLTILGDDFIGLEFASIYRQFGAKVQLFSENSRDRFLKMVDYDIAKVALEYLETTGIEFFFDSTIEKVVSQGRELSMIYQADGTVQQISTGKILLAVGRRPNVAHLNLDAANVALNEDGSIQVNKHLETTTKNIYALGDVKGGLQEAFIASDDVRIVLSDLFEQGSYDLSDRKSIPETIFIQPPLAMIGLSEELARGNGYDVKIATLSAERIPQANLLNQTTGLYKAIVDADTNLILGTFLFGEASHEVVNIVATAIDAALPYTVLANQVFTHPTMSEALSELFKRIVQ